MPEVWLRSNRRVMYFSFVPAFVLFGLSFAVTLLLPRSGWFWGVHVVCWCVIAFAGLLFASVLTYCRLPLLAYANGHLLVYLRRLDPIRVPIEIVECFFVGQGPSMLPDRDGKEVVASTLIVRLAESAKDWQHRDDIPAKLAHWCEGYITIRGTWSEPVTKDILRRLNQRLVEVHRENKAAAQAGKDTV